jgi:hypothetical protein
MALKPLLALEDRRGRQMDGICQLLCGEFRILLQRLKYL